MTAAGAEPGGTIAVVLKGYPRLSETFIAQELHGLEGLGFKLRFVSLRHPTDNRLHPIHREIEAPVSYLPEYLHQEPWRVMKGVSRATMKPGFGRALRQWFKDLPRDRSGSRIRRFGQACVLAAELPDDVSYLYAHFIHTPAAVTGYASLMTGLPWSCSAHAKDIWTSPDWELRQNLAATEWVATCTQFGWKHLQSLADDPAKVQLIYHGLDLARFPPPPERPASNRDGTSPDQPVRLLSVGRAVDKKGFDVLLDAFAKLPDSVHWHWTHIGGGDALSKLKAQANKLGIGQRITWLGAQPQEAVLEAYQLSDMFVLPCRITANGDRDGLPNVLVEALSQRLMCISTPISGVPELITDGKTGALVASEDAHALAGAIAELAADPQRRHALAAAGEAHVRRSFDMLEGLAKLAALFPGAMRDDNPASERYVRAAE
jgi:glycosyltransferase involved in cell wall biosynthesis